MTASNAALMNPLSTLTPREREIFDLVVTGATSKAIARELGNSFRTVEIHRSRIKAKLGGAGLVEWVLIALGPQPKRRYIIDGKLRQRLRGLGAHI